MWVSVWIRVSMLNQCKMMELLWSMVWSGSKFNLDSGSRSGPGFKSRFEARSESRSEMFISDPDPNNNFGSLQIRIPNTVKNVVNINTFWKTQCLIFPMSKSLYPTGHTVDYTGKYNPPQRGKIQYKAIQFCLRRQAYNLFRFLLCTIQCSLIILFSGTATFIPRVRHANNIIL